MQAASEAAKNNDSTKTHLRDMAASVEAAAIAIALDANGVCSEREPGANRVRTGCELSHLLAVHFQLAIDQRDGFINHWMAQAFGCSDVAHQAIDSFDVRQAGEQGARC